MDRDNDGDITAEDILEALAPFGVGEEEATKMIRGADADGDNSMSFEEFTRAYHTGPFRKVQMLNNSLLCTG